MDTAKHLLHIENNKKIFIKYNKLVRRIILNSRVNMFKLKNSITCISTSYLNKRIYENINNILKKFSNQKNIREYHD